MIQGDWRREHVFGLVELFRPALLTSRNDELADAAAAAATGGVFQRVAHVARRLAHAILP